MILKIITHYSAFQLQKGRTQIDLCIELSSMVNPKLEISRLCQAKEVSKTNFMLCFIPGENHNRGQLICFTSCLPPSNINYFALLPVFIHPIFIVQLSHKFQKISKSMITRIHEHMRKIKCNQMNVVLCKLILSREKKTLAGPNYCFTL